jgi:hypothetical protein
MPQPPLQHARLTSVQSNGDAHVSMSGPMPVMPPAPAPPLVPALPAALPLAPVAAPSVCDVLPPQLCSAQATSHAASAYAHRPEAPCVRFMRSSPAYFLATHMLFLQAGAGGRMHAIWGQIMGLPPHCACQAF